MSNLLKYRPPISTIISKTDGNFCYRLDFGYIIPLHIVAANGLDSKYLKSDGSWPQALPKPGVYVTDLGQYGFVGYTSEVFRLTLPVSIEFPRSDVKIR